MVGAIYKYIRYRLAEGMANHAHAGVSLLNGMEQWNGMITER